MAGLEIHKVENKADYKTFFAFPWTVYRDDPNWVPPLLSMRHELIDKEKNPVWKDLEGDYFIARRGDQPVGTIAAYVNHKHNDYHKENIAWFGAFETLNDPESATALLQTALDWAKAHGYTTVRGPQTFTNMEECGLLIENFDRPILLMPYNPPYYQTLIEGSGLGFTKVMDTVSLYHNWSNFEGSDLRKRLDRILTRIHRNNKITVRPIDKRNLKAEFELFRQLYNAAWHENWGYTPYSKEELKSLVDGLGMIFNPNLACFAYVDDEPVGFMLCVPDFSQVLLAAKARPGIPEPITLLRALWNWKIQPKITWVRVPVMGVKKEYRQIGVDLVMYDYLLKALAQTPYKHLDSGWVLETNDAMIKMGEGLGMEPYKRYRFYEAPV